MVVRDARAAELSAAGELTVEAYGELASERYAKILRDAPARARDARLLVCIDDDELLGTATFISGPGPLREISRADETEFRMLAVAPQARGRGAGKALIGHMLELTRHLGRRRLVCSSPQGMVAAHHLYERMGFARSPERDWSPMEGVQLLVFARELGDAQRRRNPTEPR